MKHILTVTALLLAPLAALHAASTPRPATKPNIIYILADDFGLPDIGCYGSASAAKAARSRLQTALDGMLAQDPNKAFTVNPATPPATDKPAKKKKQKQQTQ